VHLSRGLELIRTGAYFEAHEELETAWRSAPPAERDFYQGLVHVAVAWYQAGRGNRVGCERQLAKAQRRLGPYAPRHEGVDVAALLAQVDAAAAQVAAGSLALDPVDPHAFEGAVQRDLEPPVAAEEEQ
jgi:predicted metal-dependent hydrolase